MYDSILIQVNHPPGNTFHHFNGVNSLFLASMRFETITIKDIARALGFSTSTVSRALRGSYEISTETKKRVLEYAEKMNYRPNPIALSLKERKSKSIGVIVCEVDNDFFSQVINGIESIAYNRGYHVIITQSHESYDREVVNVNHLASRSVDGLLVSVSAETTDMEHFRRLHEKGLPIVFLDRVPEDIVTHKVIVDNFQASYNATEELIRRGCKRIAVINSAPQLSISKERLAGYKAALQYHDAPIKEEYIRYCNYGGMVVSEIEDAINRLMKSKQPPDGLLAASGRITVACLSILRKKNPGLPQPLQMIGFSNSSMIELLHPKPAVVRQPAFEMGQVATELLIDIIESKRPVTEFETRVLKAELDV